MFGKPELIDSFLGEYKAGVFSKKKMLSLYVYESYIDGTATMYFDWEFTEYEFNIKYEDITNIEEKVVEGINCLAIDFLNGKTIVNENRISTILFPNLIDFDKAEKLLLDIWEQNQKRQREVQQRRAEREKRLLIEKQQHEEACQKYFQDYYAFHISDDNNPYYELQKDGLQFACIYIDRNKNLNFLKIDGESQEESNACIPYDKIHYYEKAGNVHYTTEISGNCTNFGGSVTGATVSKAASIVGGLLLGPMGMAAGAILSQKPMQVTVPSTSLDISSRPNRIDDRSVILNYYSDAKKQLMDIELPADTYNFLQTYLPERKYGIVLEVEKNNAVRAFGNGNAPGIAGRSLERIESVDDDTEQFEKRIKKLKIMYDNGVLSEEEYASEKKRILSEI